MGWLFLGLVVSAHAAPTGGEYVAGIMDRNLFDASNIGAHPAGVPQVATQLDVALLGTVVTEPAEFSSALVRHGESTRGVSQGDPVAECTVADIARMQITLACAGEHVVLDLLQEVSEPAEAASSPPPTKGGPVRRLEDGSMGVERQAILDVLQDAERLSDLGRVRPVRGADGQIEGYRLSAVKGPLAKLGLKRGDVIREVDGVPLTSAAAALGLVSGLETKDRVCLGLSRRGGDKEHCVSLL